jgi:hypothetical protein
MAYDEVTAQLVRENHRLRMLLCEVLKALGNGSGASPECSLEFLSNIPEEVRLEVAELRNAVASSANPLPGHPAMPCDRDGGEQ